MIQHLLDTAQFIFFYYSSSLKYITYTYSICFLIYRFLSVRFIQIPVSIYLTDFFFFNPVTNSSLFGKVNCPTLPLNRLYFLGLQNHCGWWLQPWNKKTLAPWKKSYDKLRQRIKKETHHFIDKGQYSQSYGFSSSHVQMWESDHKEGWAPKDWCFWTVVLEKTL